MRLVNFFCGMENSAKPWHFAAPSGSLKLHLSNSAVKFRMNGSNCIYSRRTSEL